MQQFKQVRKESKNNWVAQKIVDGVTYRVTQFDNPEKAARALNKLLREAKVDVSKRPNHDLLKAIRRSKMKSKLSVGDRVEATYHNSREYYPGTIVSVRTRDRTGKNAYDVSFDDGDEQKGVPESAVRRMDENGIAITTSFQYLNLMGRIKELRDTLSNIQAEKDIDNAGANAQGESPADSIARKKREDLKMKRYKQTEAARAARAAARIKARNK